MRSSTSRRSPAIACIRSPAARTARPRRRCGRLTRELAADLAPLGIRVNAVCPGEINTAILSPGTDQLVSRIPLRRLGSPTEVAAVIYYLCGPEASYVTGAEIPVNGGQDVY